jgi:hypothetical protein
LLLVATCASTESRLNDELDDVPEPAPDRSVCISGELCTEGGG